MTAPEELNRTILLCRDYVAERLCDQEICHCFQSLHVLCVSDLRNLSSHSGQTALVTLVSLLNRMGMQVGLTVPDAPMLFPQPPFSGSFIRTALIASSEKLVAGATLSENPNFNPDITFVLGDTKIDTLDAFSWRLYGTDWCGALALAGRTDSHAWTANWSVGSMVSAALAANEAFKFVMRRLPLREQDDSIFFEPSLSCSWDFGSLPIPSERLDLGEVDIISAGAICQAAAYALMRLPNVHMLGRIFDDDLTSTSNLNRNMLTLVSDVGSKKVLVVAQRCGTKLRLEPVPDRFTNRSSVLRRLAPRVLVGVDDIPSRWEAQRSEPNWLAVGGTSHFSVSSSAHRLGEPCCGCLHPIDDPAGANPIPTVSFVSFWAGLAMAVRLVREALAAPYSLNQQHLWLTPLRIDRPHAGMWSPVALRQDCPVPCFNSTAAIQANCRVL
jgi:hypothetical protein